MKIKSLNRWIGIVLALTLGILSLASCGKAAEPAENSPSSSPSESSSSEPSPSESPTPEPVTVKVGVVGENNEQWDVVKETLAKENITLELVKFSDYTLPNQALADGETDLNAFQHKAFLQNEIKTKGYEITDIGDTLIAPLGLFSQKIKSVSEIKKGDKIAIPNDAVNGGRALKVLEAQGLLKVDPGKGYSPTVADITDNPLELDIVEVDASQTASLLPDVTAALINGGYAVDFGLNPKTDSIALEEVISGSDNPFINVIAARTADKDNPIYKKVVEAYQTDEVKKVIEDTYKGAYIVAW